MRNVFIVLFLGLAMMIFAQNQVNLVQGNFDFLKDQKEVNIQLKFENTTYQAENFTETQYLENRKNDVLANPKKGEESWQKWYKEWERYKSSEYLKYFMNGCIESKSKIVFTNDIKAKYTLIIDAKWIYVGWSAGLVGQEGKLTADLIFVETDNPSNIIMKLYADKILGKKRNKDFTWEYVRVAATYEDLGRKLGKEIQKSLNLR